MSNDNNNAEPKRVLAFTERHRIICGTLVDHDPIKKILVLRDWRNVYRWECDGDAGGLVDSGPSRAKRSAVSAGQRTVSTSDVMDMTTAAWDRLEAATW